jgi:hypothetical protein
MSAPAVDKELDPAPVVAALIEKSATGKIAWEATANEDTFVSSVGGPTLRIALERSPDYPDEMGDPALYLLDAKGKTIWQIYSSQTKTGLWELYRLAQRVGNKVDDRMAALMDALQRL